MTALNSYRLLITGERDWTDRNAVEEVLEQARKRSFRLGLTLVIIHGACETGADHFAKEWCERNEVEQDPFPAEWHPNGQAAIDLTAGPRRNAAMVASSPRRWVAFWSGKTHRSGTNGCTALAVAAGLDGYVVAKKRAGILAGDSQ